MKTVGYHIPVMLKETLDLLITDRKGTYLDCTLGGGGHSKAILDYIDPEGYVLAVDRDAEAVKYASELLGEYSNFKAHQICFSRLNELDEIVFGMKFDGILLDLGLSSRQIDDAGRGFSYMSESVLDMRMNRDDEMSALEVVNKYPEEELTSIFFKYGEENRSRKIAAAIVSQRDKKVIGSTKELAGIIASVTPSNFRIKTLSRIFQAVRIEVNRELEELDTALNFSMDILKPGGRCAVISYHSLEDRIVKNFIKDRSEGCTCPKNFPVCVCGKKPSVSVVTRKPVTASDEETARNSRARSAKLRVFCKL
ncbi:MAG TPA: 16S rRNA (cytosine(1402)-N(4))-methyltransferase RsmH [Clostridiales bacterium]|nr:16S rRNA (cytosine(1402)-N(4))-methyltransferase RsmH [Clostridiales bacterium]